MVPVINRKLIQGDVRKNITRWYFVFYLIWGYFRSAWYRFLTLIRPKKKSISWRCDFRVSIQNPDAVIKIMTGGPRA